MSPQIPPARTTVLLGSTFRAQVVWQDRQELVALLRVVGSLGIYVRDTRRISRLKRQRQPTPMTEKDNAYPLSYTVRRTTCRVSTD